LKVNTTRRVTLARILKHYAPADYIPPRLDLADSCYATRGYHNCDSKTPREKWNYMLEGLRMDDRYEHVYEGIKEAGFVVPLAAKLVRDDIVIFDGHHRVAAALDLGYASVPVYVAGKTGHWSDLISADSGWWRGGGVDSPFGQLVA
jgi:hypothetical protein